MMRVAILVSVLFMGAVFGLGHLLDVVDPPRICESGGEVIDVGYWPYRLPCGVTEEQFWQTLATEQFEPD